MIFLEGRFTDDALFPQDAVELFALISHLQLQEKLDHDFLVWNRASPPVRIVSTKEVRRVPTKFFTQRLIICRWGRQYVHQVVWNLEIKTAQG